MVIIALPPLLRPKTVGEVWTVSEVSVTKNNDYRIILKALQSFNTVFVYVQFVCLM